MQVRKKKEMEIKELASNQHVCCQPYCNTYGVKVIKLIIRAGVKRKDHHH